MAEGPVDLLMLDVDLKGCDVIDICRTMRGTDSTEHRTAVIVITGRHDLASRLLAFSAGADDWLAKPLESRDIRSRLERWGEPPAEQADLVVRRRQAIREIVRSMCHEMNNPLGAAVIGVDLVMRRGNLLPESARDLGVVRDNLDRISGILMAMQGVKGQTYVE